MSGSLPDGAQGCTCAHGAQALAVQIRENAADIRRIEPHVNHCIGQSNCRLV